MLLGHVQHEMHRVSPEYFKAKGNYEMLRSGNRSMQISCRVQITPFLKSGWIIGHRFGCAL